MQFVTLERNDTWKDNIDPYNTVQNNLNQMGSQMSATQASKTSQLKWVL